MPISARWALAGCSWRSLRVRNRAPPMSRARGERVGAGLSQKAREIKEVRAPRRFDRIVEGSKIGAVVLAAGQSSRFRAGGGPDLTKLVAKLDGKAIVQRVVETALAARARPIVVVTGYARDSVQ